MRRRQPLSEPSDETFLHTRTCPTCESKIVRKDKESFARFEVRTFCNRKCLNNRTSGGLHAVY